MANVTIKNVLKNSYKNFATEAFRRFASKSAFNAVSDKVDTLIGSDTSKSVRTIANEELAVQLIPENAQEALDTLQEIASWIQSHPAEAAAINTKLTLGTHEVDDPENEGAKKTEQYDTVKAYVEAYVASQISNSSLSGSDAISVVNKIVSLIIDAANANGLVIGSDGLKLTVASATSTGALTSTDWSTFNAKQEQVVVSESTGDGNVITAIELDADKKTVKSVKGITALVESDFEAVSASEITTIFNEAQAIVTAEEQETPSGD